MLKYCEILPYLTVGMSWSSRNYRLDKTEFIAPMDAYPYEKKHLHTSYLRNIIYKHFIQIVKLFEILS